MENRRQYGHMWERRGEEEEEEEGEEERSAIFHQFVPTILLYPEISNASNHTQSSPSDIWT